MGLILYASSDLLSRSLMDMMCLLLPVIRGVSRYTRLALAFRQESRGLLYMFLT
jgi:hypothetical protein